MTSEGTTTPRAEEGRLRRAHELHAAAAAAAGAAGEATLLRRSHRRENGGAVGKVFPVRENGSVKPLLSAFSGGSGFMNLSVDLCVVFSPK